VNGSKREVLTLATRVRANQAQRAAQGLDRQMRLDRFFDELCDLHFRQLIELRDLINLTEPAQQPGLWKLLAEAIELVIRGTPWHEAFGSLCHALDAL
jgi:hypothetical protein